MRPIMAGKGDTIPVSKVSEDGTFPSDTCQYEKRDIAILLPEWDPSACIQCNLCVAACPHATIVSKIITTTDKENFVKAKEPRNSLHYLQWDSRTVRVSGYRYLRKIVRVAEFVPMCAPELKEIRKPKTHW